MTIKIDPDGKCIEIDGLKIEVVSPEKCDKADFVVCGPRSYFADDVHTTCHFCAMPIVHRPYAPAAPPKVCVECMVKHSQGELKAH